MTDLREVTKATRVEEARTLLANIEDSLPWKVNEVTMPDDPNVIATIRNAAGYPILAPHPEAISLLTGSRAIFEFVVYAPRVIRALVEELEGRSEGEVPQA